MLNKLKPLPTLQQSKLRLKLIKAVMDILPKDLQVFTPVISSIIQGIKISDDDLVAFVKDAKTIVDMLQRLGDPTHILERRGASADTIQLTLDELLKE